MAGSWLAGFRPYALLTALCLMLYAPGIATIPPLDRDEARFAQATRQMLETGDFLRIRFQREARNKKPAGIYWLQAAAVATFSDAESTAIWPYRLPSLLAATGAVLMLFAFGKAMVAPGAAFAAAVMLATSLALVAEAHIAKTDAALLAAIVAGQGFLGLCYRRRDLPLGAAAGFWVAEAAAILIKGPIGPGLALVTAVSLSIADRDARWLRGLRPLRGIALTVLILAPWLIAIEHATSGQFLGESLGHDLFGKLVGVQESHGAPPLTYIALSLATFWPGSLFLAPALIEGWRRRDAPATRFLLAWLVPAWVLIELVPTKLPHYALPLYPALALLAGTAIGGFANTGWARRADLTVRGLWTLTTLALAAALVVLGLRYGPSPFAGGAVLVIGAGAAMLFRPSLAALAALALALTLTLTLELPGLDGLWLSRSAAALVAAHPPPAGEPLVAVGYNEPSLVFLLGTQLRLDSAHGAAELLEKGGEALVSDREQAVFQQALGARGLAARTLGAVAGTDYSTGRRLTVTLYAVGPS
ncbi:MAG TPA: glycosyltransferase family 39 protein [Stellaceae bacterium]|nr:glycosyltransferase family 39 protein [Stellaceae bacterium]